MEQPHVTTIGRCYCQMADVIAIDILMILIALRLMLLPNIVVDVKTTFWQLLYVKWQME